MGLFDRLRSKRVERGIRLIKRNTERIGYLYRNKGVGAAYNYVFCKLFVRGENIGAGILDPIWRLFPNLFTPYPFMLEIEVTTRCNLRCTICEHTYWGKDEYINRDLTFEDFKKVIKEFPKLKYLNVTGEGSSFLNKDFLKILEYLKTRNIFVVVIDSFTAVNEKTLRRLIELNADRVWISLDAAAKETYEKIRVGANFDVVLRNVKRFFELKKELNNPFPETGFRFVFTKQNFHEMHDFLDLVHSFGDRSDVDFAGLLEFEETKSLLYEPTDEFIESLCGHAKKLGIELTYGHPQREPEKMMPMRNCLSWTEPYIMMGGFVVSCCSVLMSNRRDFLRKNAFGNVFEMPFGEIWRSERYRKFRSLVPRETGMVPIFCKGCRGVNTIHRESTCGTSPTI